MRPGFHLAEEGRVAVLLGGTLPETALITGASRGLGYALAVAFTRAGYKLLLHCRKQKNQKKLSELFPESVVIGGDLRDHTALQWLEKIIRDKQIKVDFLVNNAGIYLGKPFNECSQADIWEVIETNLIAPMILAKMFWSGLKLLINVSSLAWTSPGSGEAIYAASKAGLSGFSNGLQFDGTKDGVRVVDLLLGSMDTDMTKGRGDSTKMISPHEVAQIVLGICEDHRTVRITSVELKRRLY